MVHLGYYKIIMSGGIKTILILSIVVSVIIAALISIFLILDIAKAPELRDALVKALLIIGVVAVASAVIIVVVSAGEKKELEPPKSPP